MPRSKAIIQRNKRIQRRYRELLRDSKYKSKVVAKLVIAEEEQIHYTTVWRALKDL